MASSPPSPEPPAKRRSRLRLVAFSAIAGLFSLLLLEGAVRIYANFVRPKMMVLDDGLGWRHAVGRERDFVNEAGERVRVVTNRFGNRGSAHPHQRVDGKYRVLVLGDSFTEGVHVGEEQLYTSVLERSSSDLEVINAGVGGYGTVQQLIYLREEGARFAPDLVVVSLFHNDLEDNCMSYYPGIGSRPYAVAEADGVRIVEPCDEERHLQFCAPLPFRGFLSRNSYLYFLFNDLFYRRFFADSLSEIQQADLDRFGPELRMRVLLGVFDHLREVVADAGARLAIVAIPRREHLQLGKSVYGEVARYCSEADIAYLDLSAALAASMAKGDEPYFVTDIHWTATGHSVAGRTIAGRVEELRARPVNGR